MRYPLVILHGWGASARSYDKLKPLLEQKGISVFVFALPGFGEAKPPDEAWSVADYADYVKAWIGQNVSSCHPEFISGSIEQESLGGNEMLKQVENKFSASKQYDKNREFILYGHSFGGRIAIKLAARQIEGLKGLILCDAAGVTPRPKFKIAVFKFLSQTGKLFFSLPILKYFQPLVRKIEYFLAGSRDYYYLQSAVMKETFKKVIEEDLALHLGKISVPTLIIWGKKDKMTPVSDAYIMKREIANSQLEVLEGVGHSPHLECPEKLSKIIESFIAK